MGLLSAALKAELKKKVPEVAFLFSFTVGGTTYRYSDAGRKSADGLYEPKVMSWGGAISRGVNLKDNTLELQNVQILLSDTDQTLTALLCGALGHSVRGAAAALVVASPNVAEADWFTLYSGRIDTFGQPSPLMWGFQLSPQDLPLRRESIPKPKISAADFPSSAIAVRDLPTPLLYGVVSSANGANDGAIPCHYVDSGGFRYLVCAGWAKAVDTVYKDGVPVAASAYTVTHPTINGRVYTLIDFTATQGTSTITCDAQGYESVGDGTGTLITDPATVAKHLLVNWIYGDYKAGPWLSDATAPVDAASFATTFFSDRGYQASVYISTSKRRGLNVVNDILLSFEAKACWTTAGRIALKVEDFTSWAYVDDLVLHEDEISDYSMDYPTANLVDSIDAQYGQTPTGGYQQALAVKDLGTGESAPEAIELPYSPAFFL